MVPNMKWLKEHFKRAIEQWFTQVLVGVLLIVGSISLTWINDFLFAPPYDYVFTFEKQPNPLKIAREKMRVSMQGMFSEMKKAKLRSYNEKEADVLLTIMPKFIESLSGEIDADQMQVWILNLSRRPLEHVSITYQSCTGYVRHETRPLSIGPRDGGASNTEILPNGVVYRYGTIKPQSSVFLKAGFNDISKCSVVIDAQTNISGLATSKYVTSDEYGKYYESLNPERANIILYLIIGIGCSVGLLMILYSLIYRSISQKLSRLERDCVRRALGQ